jgi:hypothetical protein
MNKILLMLITVFFVTGCAADKSFSIPIPTQWGNLNMPSLIDFTFNYIEQATITPITLNPNQY